MSAPKLESVDLDNPNADAADAPLRPGAAGDMMAPGGFGRHKPLPAATHAAAEPSKIHLRRFDFIVQFCWQPKTPTERRDAKKAQEQPANPAQP